MDPDRAPDPDPRIRSWIRIRNPEYGSKDLDPYQNVTDPEYCSLLSSVMYTKTIAVRGTVHELDSDFGIRIGFVRRRFFENDDD
jgi:hypothetical protein